MDFSARATPRKKEKTLEHLLMQVQTKVYLSKFKKKNSSKRIRGFFFETPLEAFPSPVAERGNVKNPFTKVRKSHADFLLWGKHSTKKPHSANDFYS